MCQTDLSERRLATLPAAVTPSQRSGTAGDKSQKNIRFFLTLSRDSTPRLPYPAFSIKFWTLLRLEAQGKPGLALVESEAPPC